MDFYQEPSYGHGFIYILSNPSMPGIYKIGLTVNSVQQRIRELNTTGVPKPFVAERIFEVDSRFLPQIELLAHDKLKDKDLHHGKEFFECSLTQCEEAVEDAIYEVTEVTATDLVGKAFERAEREKRRQEYEEAQRQKEIRENQKERQQKVEQLNRLNRDIDRKRESFIENEKNEKEPILDRIMVFFGLLVLAVSVGLMLGPLGLLAGPILLFYGWKWLSTPNVQNIKNRAERLYPHKNLADVERGPSYYNHPSYPENTNLVYCPYCHAKNRVVEGKTALCKNCNRDLGKISGIIHTIKRN